MSRVSSPPMKKTFILLGLITLGIVLLAPLAMGQLMARFYPLSVENMLANQQQLHLNSVTFDAGWLSSSAQLSVEDWNGKTWLLTDNIRHFPLSGMSSPALFSGSLSHNDRQWLHYSLDLERVFHFESQPAAAEISWPTGETLAWDELRFTAALNTGNGVIHARLASGKLHWQDDKSLVNNRDTHIELVAKTANGHITSGKCLFKSAHTELTRTTSHEYHFENLNGTMNLSGLPGQQEISLNIEAGALSLLGEAGSGSLTAQSKAISPKLLVILMEGLGKPDTMQQLHIAEKLANELPLALKHQPTLNAKLEIDLQLPEGDRPFTGKLESQLTNADASMIQNPEKLLDWLKLDAELAIPVYLAEAWRLKADNIHGFPISGGKTSIGDLPLFHAHPNHYQMNLHLGEKKLRLNGIDYSL